MYSLSILILVVCILQGCTSEESTIEASSWSDSSTEIAYLEHIYDVSVGGGVSNSRVRGGISDLDGKNKKSITQKMRIYDLNSPAMLFEIVYKSSNDYVLVRRANSLFGCDSEGNFTDNIEYSIFYLNGDLLKSFLKRPLSPCIPNPKIQLSYYPASMRIMPSVSGSIIAVAETIDTSTVELAFYNYADGFNESYKKFTLNGFLIGGLFWINDDYLLINVLPDSVSTGWLLVTSDKVTPLDDSTFQALCLEGVRVGSQVNELGDFIRWQKLKNKPVIEKSDDYYNTELKSWTTAVITRKADNPVNCIAVESLL